MMKLEIKEDRFSMIKEQVRQDYTNFEKDQPYQHAMYNMAIR